MVRSKPGGHSWAPRRQGSDARRRRAVEEAVAWRKLNPHRRYRASGHRSSTKQTALPAIRRPAHDRQTARASQRPAATGATWAYSLAPDRAHVPGTSTTRSCLAGLASISTFWHFIGSFSIWSRTFIIAAMSSNEPGRGTTQAL